MARVPIVRVGDTLIATVQEDLHDRDALDAAGGARRGARAHRRARRAARPLGRRDGRLVPRPAAATTSRPARGCSARRRSSSASSRRWRSPWSSSGWSCRASARRSTPRRGWPCCVADRARGASQWTRVAAAEERLADRRRGRHRRGAPARPRGRAALGFGAGRPEPDRHRGLRADPQRRALRDRRARRGAHPRAASRRARRRHRDRRRATKARASPTSSRRCARASPPAAGWAWGCRHEAADGRDGDRQRPGRGTTVTIRKWRR